MANILSEFQFFLLYVDGGCFWSPDALHDEFSFKLGLPVWYGRNWDALLDCLSSIGSKEDKSVEYMIENAQLRKAVKSKFSRRDCE